MIMKYQTERVEFEDGSRFEVPLLGQPKYETATVRGHFAGSFKWNRVTESAFGKSDIYKDKLKAAEDRNAVVMDLDLSNVEWRASHRTSRDYVNWLDKNVGRIW